MHSDRGWICGKNLENIFFITITVVELLKQSHLILISPRILNPQLISYLLPMADRVQIGMPCLLILFQHYFLVCAFWLFLAICPLKLPPHVDPQPVKCCDVVRLAKRKTVLLHGCADENSL